MAALSLSIDALRPLNRWDHDSIRPGAVGSVGDVIVTPKFKHSAPDLPLRFDPYFRGKNSVFLGANVTDGDHANFDSGGGPSRTIDSNWGGRRRFRVGHGWHYQDMRAPDKLTEPLMGATPDYSWHNKLATVYESRRTGDKFLPLPGGYQPSPGEMTRGGAYPFTRDLVPGQAPGSIINNGVGYTSGITHPTPERDIASTKTTGVFGASLARPKVHGAYQHVVGNSSDPNARSTPGRRKGK